MNVVNQNQFKWTKTKTWSFSFILIKWKRWRQQMNVPPSLAISIAMAVRQCNTAHIAQWRRRRSRAFIKPTKRCHRTTTCSASLRRPPGQQQTKRQCKWQCKCVHFAGHFDGRGGVPVLYRTHRPMKEVHGFHKSHINAAIRPAPHSNSINRTRLPLILGVYFIVKLLKKSSSCPNNSRGMTHQSDKKHINDMSEYLFVGVVNKAFNCYNKCFVLRVINQ